VAEINGFVAKRSDNLDRQGCSSKTMPMCFQASFGKKVAVMIDCFEIFISLCCSTIGRAIAMTAVILVEEITDDNGEEVAASEQRASPNYQGIDKDQIYQHVPIHGPTANTITRPKCY